jgi:hypothetical protein
MNFAGMNYLAIVLAAAAGFAFGSVYYMALSGAWLQAVEKTKDQLMPSGKPKPGPFIVSIAALLVMAWVLAGTIGHLGAGEVTLKNGVISAFFLWLGFVATTLAVNNAFAGRKASLTAIDAGHWLGVLLLQGLIIGVMGV